MTNPRVGDWGTKIDGTIKDETGAIVNLTSLVTAVIKIRKPDDTVVSATAVVLNPPGTDGKVRYVVPVGANLFAAAGLYQAQFLVTFNDGQYSSDIINITTERILEEV